MGPICVASRWKIAKRRSRICSRDASDRIQLSDVVTDGAKLLEVAVQYGLEGIVSKRLGSAHSSNRCLSWLKTKTTAGKAANADRGERFRRSR
jgi:ATP-dependent DNA ligase